MSEEDLEFAGSNPVHQDACAFSGHLQIFMRTWIRRRSIRSRVGVARLQSAAVRSIASKIHFRRNGTLDGCAGTSMLADQCEIQEFSETFR